MYKSSDFSVHARAPCCGARGQGRPVNPDTVGPTDRYMGLNTGLRAEPEKDDQAARLQCSLASDSRLMCWGELLGPWRDGALEKQAPDSGMIRFRRTCCHMPAGPRLCPRDRSWVGRDLCHPVAGPGRALGGESENSVPRGWCSQEEQVLGQQAPCPFSRAHSSPVCSDWLLAQWASTSLPWGGQESGLRSTDEGPATLEGLGGPGKACLYPEMGRDKDE